MHGAPRGDFLGSCRLELIVRQARYVPDLDPNPILAALLPLDHTRDRALNVTWSTAHGR